MTAIGEINLDETAVVVVPYGERRQNRFNSIENKTVYLISGIFIVL